MTPERRILAEHLYGEEAAEWMALTPVQRWEATNALWAFFLSSGGSLDPEPDLQSPFYAPATPCPLPADGRPGLRVVRRGGV